MVHPVPAYPCDSKNVFVYVQDVAPQTGTTKIINAFMLFRLKCFTRANVSTPYLDVI